MEEEEEGRKEGEEGKEEEEEGRKRRGGVKVGKEGEDHLFSLQE